jgi:putative membrane protein
MLLAGASITHFYQLTPLTILISCILFVKTNHAGYSQRYILLLAFVAVMGWLAEYIGVHTTVPFGNYDYGTTLGYMVLDIPILMCLNWGLLIYASLALVEQYYSHYPTLYRSLIAATIITVLDMYIEPVATLTGMWYWADMYPPIQNYIAWFVLSLGFNTLIYRSRIQLFNEMGEHIIYSHYMYFTAICLHTIL